MHLLLALLFSVPLWASPQTGSYPNQWLSLLHYRQTPDGWESEVDGKNFFLTPHGKTDPQAEWEAFAALPSAAPERCAFPMRSRLHQFSTAHCTRLNAFRTDLKADAISLVFSSYYLAQPASAFGHVFLVFRHEGRPPLLDIGVNYAANPDTKNPLLYAWRGLTGRFKGRFSLSPYFAKVAEYNDLESRDLWEYKLNLNDEQIKVVTDHLWELGQAHFDYYYLSENCGYHLLSLLNVALPVPSMTKNLGTVVLPIDVVRAVTSHPDLVETVEVRPSNATRFAERWATLSNAHKRQWIAWNHGRLGPEQMATSTLDAAMDFLDYRFGEELRTPASGEVHLRKTGLLKARRQRKTPPAAISSAHLPPPHMGHFPARLGLYAQGKAGLTLQFRVALHDPLDPAHGTPRDTRLEFLKGDVSWSEPGVRLSHLTLLHVGAYTPLRPYRTPLSWELQLGWQNGAFLTGGAGLTWAVGERGRLGVLAMTDHRLVAGVYLPGIGGRIYASAQWGSFSLGAQAQQILAADSPATQWRMEIRRHFGQAWSLWAARDDRTPWQLGVHCFL